ncbi:1343_t:CDS:2 [Diversispora eburnea]|uniref:1343_t:CDS:1 n=1 Tax=Diversispora eburnea TaxID=1213867 RepID=A0A9N9AP66_9GLOM|nr:1343_t:CDS:2 [Diversispora eburnea]
MVDLMNLMNFLGWAFFPQLATNLVQKTYYKIFGVKPQQPKYEIHRRRIYIFIILIYLLYTVADVITSRPPNYYNVLKVDRDFTPKEIKTNLRKLQLAFHPDKNKGQEGQEGAQFIEIRVAYDTLTDPVKRFAYDRFGPQIKEWNDCSTIRDYIAQSWVTFVGFYTGTGILLLVLYILGKGKFGRFWRFLIFFSMACTEASMILNPEQPGIISYIFSRWIIFEQISILRQSFVVTFIAISQVGPILFPDETNIRPALQNLEVLSSYAAEETKNQLKLSFRPFQGDPNAQELVKMKMKELYIDNFLQHNNPEFYKINNEKYNRIIPDQKKDK